MQFEIVRRASPIRLLLWRAFLPALALGALGTTSAAGKEPLELPTLSGYARAATRDLNNRGRVVGLAFAGPVGAPQQAVLWTRRPWKPVTVEPLPTLAGAVHSAATAVSRSGIPVGFALGVTVQAVVWKKGVAGEWEAVELEPPPGFTRAFATGVNSRGVIVGWAMNLRETIGGRPFQRAVLWQPQPDGGHAAVELETPDGFLSAASGITERGDVVGTTFRDEFVDGVSVLRSDVVVWHRTFGRRGCGSRSPVVLASLPGLPTNLAPAINLRGDVVAEARGRVGAVTITRAVLWRRNRGWTRHHWKRHHRGYRDPIELPVPEGFTDAAATDINAFGRVVGTAFGQEGAATFSHAVAWSRSRRGWAIDVLDPPENGSRISAVRVNDLGRVVGNDFFPSPGRTGALLWAPSRWWCWKR